MKYNNKNKELVKFFVKERVNGHNNYTNPDIFTGRLASEVFRKSDTFCVMFNIEIVFLLLSKYNINPSKITFVGDDADKKKKWVEYQGVKYINREKLNNMKFTYTLMNPAFDKTAECFAQAKSITTEKVLIVCQSSHMERKQMLNNLEYYEALGDKAFDEQIMTSLAVYDMNGCDETNIKFKDGAKTVIKNITAVPGEDNKDDYEFACKVINKCLQGIEVNYGALESPKVKQSEDGIPLIFNVGSVGDDSFSKILFIDKEQQKYATGYEKHKVVFNKNASIGNIGAIKYAGPEYGTGHNTMSIITDSKETALKYIDYLQSDKVKSLVRGIKTGAIVNKKDIFKLIPILEHKDKWI